MLNPSFMTVAVEQLRPNPWNTNRVSPEAEEKIRTSISRNGLFKPIVVRKVPGQGGWEIVGGQHRWEQAIALGHKDVPICNLGEIDDTKAKEIGVIDNARYGADDTLSFAELLKEIGTTADLQTFLPYGEADLDAIFSASTIALDDLGADLDSENPADETEDESAPAPTKVAKTHTIMRFKVSLFDAERITALIARTQKELSFTGSDDLTNAGDALVHLLGDLLDTPAPSAPSFGLEDLDDLALEIADKENRS